MTKEQLNNVENTVEALRDKYIFQFDTATHAALNTLTEDVRVVTFISKEDNWKRINVRVSKTIPFTVDYAEKRIFKKSQNNFAV